MHSETIYRLFAYLTPSKICTWQEELDLNEVLIKRYIGREVRAYLLVSSFFK